MVREPNLTEVEKDHPALRNEHLGEATFRPLLAKITQIARIPNVSESTSTILTDLSC